MKVVYRGYGATALQIGHIYNGYIIRKRRKIPKWKRWYYDGKMWEFLGTPCYYRT